MARITSYTCSYCGRNGVGFIERRVKGLSKSFSNFGIGDKEYEDVYIPPDGWLTIGKYNLCTDCSCNSEAQKIIKEKKRKDDLIARIGCLIIVILVALFLLIASLVGHGNTEQNNQEIFETERQKISYALGAHFGNMAYQQLVVGDSVDVNLELYLEGFVTYYKKDSSNYLMDDSTIFNTLVELSKSHQK